MTSDQNPSGFCFLVQIRAFVYLNLTGISKCKYERKNEKYSGRSSKKAPSCKRPIATASKNYPMLINEGSQES